MIVIYVGRRIRWNFVLFTSRILLERKLCTSGYSGALKNHCLFEKPHLRHEKTQRPLVKTLYQCGRYCKIVLSEPDEHSQRVLNKIGPYQKWLVHGCTMKFRAFKRLSFSGFIRNYHWIVEKTPLVVSALLQLIAFNRNDIFHFEIILNSVTVETLQIRIFFAPLLNIFELGLCGIVVVRQLAILVNPKHTIEKWKPACQIVNSNVFMFCLSEAERGFGLLCTIRLKFKPFFDLFATPLRSQFIGKGKANGGLRLL